MQRVLITGGSRGVGRATALQLAARGAAVAVLARDTDAIAETVAAVTAAGGRGVPAIADLGDAGAVERAVSAAIDALGGLDGLVLNAGSAINGPVETYDPADWDTTLAANLTGAFLVARAALPALKRAGATGDARIVAVASGAAYAGYPGMAAYCAAKWGLRGFMFALAEEVKGDHIRCCTLSPGSILTAFGGTTPAEKAARPGRAYLTPEEVADAIIHLLDQPGHIWTQEMNLWPVS